MSNSKIERFAPCRLAWSLDAATGASNGANIHTLRYEIEALEDLYVADRLWDNDVDGRRIRDPFGVYRFVHDGNLRLVLAPAPRPPNIHIRKHYIPLYSGVAAGETRKNEISIRLPVDEYSALARDVGSATVIEHVAAVTLVVGYRTRASLPSRPIPPLNETADEAGYIVHAPQLLISAMAVAPVPVKRRTGYIARFPLPGEPGPGPIPLELLR